MTALSNLLALLSLDSSPYLEALNSSQSATDGFAKQLSNVGGAVVVGTLAAAATAVTAVGVAAWDAGETVDDALDRISIATGAMGPELQALRGDFEAVFTSVPTDAATAADVIGVLNSRLDASGPALQNLASPLLEVSRLLGGDAKTNAELFTRVMGDWTIPVENGANSLDMLFVAAQKTGAPMETLMAQIVQYGAPMRNFGFDFADAGALLASFAAQGVNTEIVMSGLRIAQGKFIKNGIDMKTGLWETIDAIQNAESSTDALAIATETFGAKAAGDMFDTIRSGKFDIEELAELMWDARGAVMESSDSVIGMTEKWEMFKNKLTTILAPIGQTMEVALSGVMDTVAEIFERPDVQAGISNFVTMIGNFINQAVTYIPVLINGFFQFISFLQNNQGIVIGILAALGVAALAWGITTAIAAWTAMVPLLPIIAVLALIAGAAYLLYQAWTNNWGGMRDTLMNAWASLQPTLETLREWLSVAIPAAVQWLSNLWTGTLLPAIQLVAGFIGTNVIPLFQAIGDLIGAMLMPYVNALANLWQNVLWPAMKASHEWFMANLFPGLRSFVEFIGGNFVQALNWVGDAIQSVIGFIERMAENLRSIQLPGWMTPGSPTPWETGLVGVGKAMNDLSRSSLPTFQAALSLQPEPVFASGAVDLQARGAVSAETGGSGKPDDTALLNDMRRMLDDLPNTIARATKTAFEKTVVSRSQ